MDKVVLSALLGVPLTIDEKLTIDATLLAKILEEEEESSSKVNTLGETVKIVPVAKSEERKELNASDTDVEKLYDTLDQLILDEKQQLQKEDDDYMIDDDDSSASCPETEAPISDSLSPYEDDLDYLSDWFSLVAARIEHIHVDMEDESQFRIDSKNKRQLLREKAAKVKTSLLRAQGRLELTMENYNNENHPSNFCPRLEKLAQLRNLTDFDKLVIITLIGSVLSPEIVRILHQQHKYANFTVGELLRLHFPELRDQIAHRHCFYKTSTLVKERIISVGEKNVVGASDLVGCYVEVDRRVLDYCLKLDTELNCLVDGTVITTPTTVIDQVVLPQSAKQLVLQTITNASRVDLLKEQLKIHHILE